MRPHEMRCVLNKWEVAAWLTYARRTMMGIRDGDAGPSSEVAAEWLRDFDLAAHAAYRTPLDGDDHIDIPASDELGPAAMHGVAQVAERIRRANMTAPISTRGTLVACCAPCAQSRNATRRTNNVEGRGYEIAACHFCGDDTRGRAVELDNGDVMQPYGATT